MATTLEKDFADFKARTETIISLLKWLGVFVAGVLATVIFNGFAISHSAGKLDSTVNRMESTVGGMQISFREFEQANQEFIRALTRLETRLESIDRELQLLRQQFGRSHESRSQSRSPSEYQEKFAALIEPPERIAVVQVFPQRVQAEHLKTRIHSLGIVKVGITDISESWTPDHAEKSGFPRYAVEIGPYSSEAPFLEARDVLSQNKIEMLTELITPASFRGKFMEKEWIPPNSE